MYPNFAFDFNLLRYDKDGSNTSHYKQDEHDDTERAEMRQQIQVGRRRRSLPASYSC
jgi:hypothetical protein